MKKIRVLVVDDSAFMRKTISDMINEEEDMQVIGTARNGEDLLERLHSSYSDEDTPDVITLDIEMPKTDGIQALKQMKEKNINIPTIVLSSVSKQSAKSTIECLDSGAFDFVSKPSGSVSLNIDIVKDELIKKIRMANSTSKLKKGNVSNEKVSNEKVSNEKIIDCKKNVHMNNMKVRKDIEAIVIGASTGGPKALYSVLTKLPKNLDIPTFVVQHMPQGFTKAFADRLNNNSYQEVVEAEDNMLIYPNTIYVAPGGFHMEIWQDKKIHLNKEPAIWGVRPAVDKLFLSATKVYGKNLVSVVLTGMGKDGANGTAKIKDNGGITISEDESTCTIYGMPKAAYATGKVDMVLKLDEIADELIKLVSANRR